MAAPACTSCSPTSGRGGRWRAEKGYMDVNYKIYIELQDEYIVFGFS
jgi:hypothetical protein